jgi:PKD repeat protein
MQMAPNQAELANIIMENGAAISDAGLYLIDNVASISATDSIQTTGESLKLFGKSLFLASEIMKYLQTGGNTDVIDKLATLGQSLQTAASELYEVGYDGYLNGGNINIARYQKALQNVNILYDSYRALKKGAAQNANVEARIISSKAEKNSNNTYQVIYFDGTESIDPFGTIDADSGYFWDFGDETFGTGAYVSHRYTEPGKYIVKLMVNGPSGFDLTTTDIKIDAVYPVSIISTNKESPIGPNPAELTVYAEEPVQFSATGSFDPAGKTDELTFSWDFGDGGKNSATGNETITYSFSNPGEYEVALEARLEKLSDVAFKKIKVLPLPPEARFKMRKNDSKYWDDYEKDYYSDHLGESLTIDFDGTASIGAPLNDAKTEFSQLIEYFWSFGDGETETQKVASVKSGQTISHTYKKSGIYTVSLKVKDINGQEKTHTKTIYISDTFEPVAEFDISPEKGYTTHTTISLDASGSRSLEGNIQQYVWVIFNSDKEQVGSYNQEIVNYTPDKPGTYEIALHVINSQGVESPTIKQSIVVASAPPVASFTMDFKSGSVNEILLDASLSTDPDTNDYLTYSWDFNSDGDFEINRIAQAQITRIFDTIGQNKVTLMVSDSSGQTDTTTQVIFIESTLMARINTLNSVAVGHAPLEVTFQAQGFYNLLEGFDYSTIKKIVWDFDDGSSIVTDTNLINGKSIQKHQFETPGRYQIHAAIHDAKGNVTDAYYSTHVGDGVNPIPAITVDPPSLSGTTKTEFSFDGGLSVNSEGAVNDLNYSWNFGDLSPIVTSQTATHSYSETGRFVVTLTLTDYKSEKISKQSITIEISDAPGVANFIVTPQNVNANSILRFDGSSSFDPDNTIVEYRWDFGDGNITRSSAPTVNHIYSSKGSYTAKLTIQTDNGVQTASKHVIITVK